MANNPFDEAMKRGFENLQRSLSEVEAQLTGVFSSVARRISEPDVVGWIELLRVLKEAAKNEKIIAAPEASAFLEKILKLVLNAHIGITADETIQPLAGEFISKNARKAAKKRFESKEGARIWVVSEWVKHKDEYENNKTDFARHYSRIILKNYSVKAGVRTICERWLKGL